MSAKPLARKLRFFERGWPWFLWAGFTAFCVFVLAVLAAMGMLEGLSADMLYRALRGYTPLGVTFGVLSVVFTFATFLYALRKRSMQESMPFRGTMMMWLNAHVYLGLLAFLLAVAHAGFGTTSLHLSTGKVLLVLLGILVFTGFAWRLVYRFVPPRAAKAVQHFSKEAAIERAEELQVEIDKICAGRSDSFQQLAAWVCAKTPPDAELNQQAAALPQNEQALFAQVARMAASRLRSIERQGLQSKYTRRLQGWRVLHVPVTFAFLLFLPIHIFYAYDAPAKMFVGMGGMSVGAFEPASSCEPCHAKIVKQWKTSMHAHGMKSPIMIVQTNQVIRDVLADAESPDPKEICINCHGPIGALLTDQATLPLTSTLGDDELLMEGISCAVCHQWNGESVTGGAGLSKFADGLVPGRTYFGPIEDPVPNAFHRSEKIALFDNPAQLCRNCHNVQYDKNGDGLYTKGTDLVLQTLWDEWNDHRREGGPSCVSCHMPVVAESDAAESALLFLEQDYSAPEREVHDHSFVGVDAPIDIPPKTDPNRPRRVSLLRRAAKLEIDADSVLANPGSVSLEVRITNVGTGHNLPGGFAFVRQMWLEVTVLDRNGDVVASSGVLEEPTDDLCDANTMDELDNPMRNFIRGCDVSDPHLVNFQLKLVDDIDVIRDPVTGLPVVDERGQPKLKADRDAQEAWIQHLDGGAVARVRPFDKKPIAPLAPREGRPIRYQLPTEKFAREGTVKVRLMFRSIPPYFLRTLGAKQPPDEEPKIATFVGNVDIVEMAAVEATIR